jgi:hypothetical protein
LVWAKPASVKQFRNLNGDIQNLRFSIFSRHLTQFGTFLCTFQVNLCDYCHMKPTTNFSAAEFQCKHCKKHGIQQAFVDHLQRLRDALRTPIEIISGFRCPKHPLEASKKAGPGMHAFGIAADILVSALPPADVYEIIVRDFPEFRGIGASRYRNTLHIDTRSTHARWAYDQKGAQVKWDGVWENLPSPTPARANPALASANRRPLRENRRNHAETRRSPRRQARKRRHQQARRRGTN